jgi:cytoskeletal protein CcmA (bactofilin family)
MFNSASKQTTREEPREMSRPVESGNRSTSGTVIGEGAHIDGSIKVTGSLRVDGEIEGGAVITTENLTVGAKGQIKADLAVKQAIISGTVNGKIRARERVELLAGAHVRGDVYAQSFKIEDGVYFHGTCVMGEAAASEVEAAMAPVKGDHKNQRSSTTPSSTSSTHPMSSTSQTGTGEKSTLTDSHPYQNQSEKRAA